MYALTGSPSAREVEDPPKSLPGALWYGLVPPPLAPNLVPGNDDGPGLDMMLR